MFSSLQYRAVVAVAETGSIKGAADRLRRSPSAVSMMITQLEERVGAPLFEGTRKNEMTEIGAYIVEEARSLLEHEDRVSRGIRAFAEGRFGHLDIACIPSVANIFLPETLDLLWRQSFSLNIRVRDSDSRTVVELVQSDRSEIGVATAIDLNERLNFAPLFHDEMAVVCAGSHPLAQLKEPLTWPQLQPYRFIGNSSYASLRALDLRQLTDTQAAYIPNITSLLSVVRSGGGITLLPRINSLHAGEGLAFMPVADQTAKRCVGILSRQARLLSPGALRFIQALKTVIARHATQENFALADEDARMEGNVNGNKN